MGAFIHMPSKEVLTWLCAEYFALLNLPLQIRFAFPFSTLLFGGFTPFQAFKY